MGTPRRGGYEPGRLAKLSVVAAAGLYFVGLYFDARRGADLNQGAFLQLLVPFLFAIPALLVGHVAYFVGRRRQRVGDIAFCVALAAQCVAVAVAAFRP